MSNYLKQKWPLLVMLISLGVAGYFYKEKNAAVEVAYMEGVLTATEDIRQIIKKECPSLQEQPAPVEAKEPVIQLPQIPAQN